MFASAINAFGLAIDPLATRVERFPPIVLVFGGPLGAATASGRQMFMNWMLAKGHPVSPLLRTPEQYSDWDKFEGYSNLIDFEKDAGNLSRTIVLFSESPGSFAELGAFCMDDVLSERLFVVIGKEHYQDTSFIANGPIKRIERHNTDAICVVEAVAPGAIQGELEEVADDLTVKINCAPKSASFDPNRERDQFLLVADMVELFGALTEKELQVLVKVMGVQIAHERLDKVLQQLVRFELVERVVKGTKRFFVPPRERAWYLNYRSASGGAAFHRERFKLKTFPSLKADLRRYNAYCEVHHKA